MYVEVNAKEALEAYADGKRVVCLERDDDIKGVVNAFSLASLLNGFAFLVDKAEPVKHDHVLADEMRLTVKQVGNYIYRYKNKEIKGE